MREILRYFFIFCAFFGFAMQPHLWANPERVAEPKEEHNQEDAESPLLGGRLWGKGKDEVARFGTIGVESGLCVNGGVEFGLSRSVAPWRKAAGQCPAGTWVCSLAERGLKVCNTSRPDGKSDSIDCHGVDWNREPHRHIGWLSDVTVLGKGKGRVSVAVAENGDLYRQRQNEKHAVWCCSPAL